MQARTDPHDVDDRVERAHFVKVDLVDRHAVDGGFGGRQAPEHLQGILPHDGGQVCRGDDGADVGQVTVGVSFCHLDVHQRGPQGAAPVLLRPEICQLPGGSGSRAATSRKSSSGHPRVDETAEKHVAGEAGGEVKVGEHGEKGATQSYTEEHRGTQRKPDMGKAKTVSGGRDTRHRDTRRSTEIHREPQKYKKEYRNKYEDQTKLRNGV